MTVQLATTTVTVLYFEHHQLLGQRHNPRTATVTVFLFEITFTSQRRQCHIASILFKFPLQTNLLLLFIYLFITVIFFFFRLFWDVRSCALFEIYAWHARYISDEQRKVFNREQEQLQPLFQFPSALDSGAPLHFDSE